MQCVTKLGKSAVWEAFYQETRTHLDFPCFESDDCDCKYLDKTKACVFEWPNVSEWPDVITCPICNESHPKDYLEYSDVKEYKEDGLYKGHFYIYVYCNYADEGLSFYAEPMGDLF
jgi:hypothetical protein